MTQPIQPRDLPVALDPGPLAVIVVLMKRLDVSEVDIPSEELAAAEGCYLTVRYSDSFVTDDLHIKLKEPV